MPARIDQRLHHKPGETPPPELFKRKDTVNFMPVRMQLATRYSSERPVDKGAEDAIFSGVDLLLVIMVPDLFDEGEFGTGEFAGEGDRGCGMRNSLYDWNMKSNLPNGGSKGTVYGQITIHYYEYPCLHRRQFIVFGSFPFLATLKKL